MCNFSAPTRSVDTLQRAFDDAPAGAVGYPVAHLVPADDPFVLCSARMHEVEGPGRHAFAAFQAARLAGPLLWILPAHAPRMPMPAGLPQCVDERLHLLRPHSGIDLLGAVEEALRATPVSLVIAEPARPLSLTQGRRLQLAAEAGGSTGLLLIRAGAGCPAAETRWHCEARAGEAGSTWHEWSLSKNKSGTTGSWTLHWDGATAAFDLVSAPGERCQPAPPPG